MANISKKEIKRRRREKIAELRDRGIMFDHENYSLQGGSGANPKYSRHHGRITNQKGAFGGPKWKRGLKPGVYETFPGTNHERHLRDKRISEAMKHSKEGKLKLMAKEL